MNIAPVQLSREETQKLLGAASGDTALLFLFLKSGNDLSEAAHALRLNETRLSCAVANLRQLGMWQEEQKRTVYNELGGKRDDKGVQVKGCGAIAVDKTNERTDSNDYEKYKGNGEGVQVWKHLACITCGL